MGKKNKYPFLVGFSVVFSLIIIFLFIARYDGFSLKGNVGQAAIYPAEVEGSMGDNMVNTTYLRQKEAIKKHLEDINGNGYTLLAVDTYSINKLNLDTYTAKSYVITEKDNNYDWLFVESVIQDDTVLAMKRIEAPYFDRMTSVVESIPDEVNQFMEEAMSSLATEDRSMFGIDYRGYEIGSMGIESIQADSIRGLGSNGDQSEFLFEVEVNIQTFDRAMTNTMLIFAKKYENRKWQIEYIQSIGGYLS